MSALIAAAREPTSELATFRRHDEPEFGDERAIGSTGGDGPSRRSDPRPSIRAGPCRPARKRTSESPSSTCPSTAEPCAWCPSNGGACPIPQRRCAGTATRFRGERGFAPVEAATLGAGVGAGLNRKHRNSCKVVREWASAPAALGCPRPCRSPVSRISARRLMWSPRARRQGRTSAPCRASNSAPPHLLPSGVDRAPSRSL